MASATWNVVVTTMVPIVLGMTWRSTIRPPTATHHPGRLDVIPHPQRQGLAPDEPGGDQPGHEGDDTDEEREGGADEHAARRSADIDTVSTAVIPTLKRGTVSPFVPPSRIRGSRKR